MEKLTGILSATPCLSGSLSAPQQGLSASLSSNIFLKLQQKTVAPSGCQILFDL